MERPVLTDREQAILAAIVKEYLATAEPVGSKSISRQLGSGFSSATIRQVMSKLMGLGLLTQPHTSAGRFPTMEGLRFYVENMIRIDELSDVERENLTRHYRLDNEEDLSLSDVLKKTSSVLSTVSQYAGIVVTPSYDDIIIKHVEFIPLGSKQILGIFVTPQGEVYKKMLSSDEDFTYVQLEKISNYCCRSFIGLTLAQARSKIATEIVSHEVIADKLISRALTYSSMLLSCISCSDVMVDGEANLVSIPEFKNAEKLRKIMEVLNEKRSLLNLLKQTGEKDVGVYIGSTDQTGENEVGIVSADYKGRGKSLGSVGVIGPARMDYNRVIPLVGFTARLISDIISFGKNAVGGDVQ